MLSIASLTSSLDSLALSTPFLHGTSTTHLTRPSKPTSLSVISPSRPLGLPLSIRAMKVIEGKVICASSDKTVAVEVLHIAPYPKYKRRVRHKRKYQAHDPDNKFRVGDLVVLELIKPMSKTKSFLAVPMPPRIQGKPKDSGEEETDEDSGEEETDGIGIPLESELDLQA